jgi:serine/threonine-protein kinase
MTEFIGKYQLRKVLGKGAMGTVYEAFDPAIARQVAVKTVKFPQADDPQAQEEFARFKREAQAAGRLTHPNIVGVYEYGETPDLACIVMEYVDGSTLKQLLDRGEVFEISAILRIMESLLAGLQYSHDRRVIHRDIKPANVMLTKSGEVKIADFGIARIENSSMTQAGTMLGTPAYMSPEQFMGTLVDARTDIYSAGVMLYQLLTREKPFEGSVNSIMHKVLNTEPPMPSILSVAVPRAFDAVVKRAMAKRPEDRFGSAAEFAQALREAHAAPPQAVADLALESDATRVEPASPPAASPTTTSPPAASQPAASPLAASLLAPTPPAGLLPAVVAPPALPALPPERKKTLPAAMLGAGALGAAAIIVIAAFLLMGKHAPASVAQTTPVPALAPAPPAKPAAPAAKPATPAAAPLASLAPSSPRPALVTALGDVPCSLLTISDSAPPQIFGFTTAGNGRLALDAAMASLPPGAAPISHVHVILGPFCNTLNTLRPYQPVFANPSAALALGFAAGPAPLRGGDEIVVAAALPAFARYLEIDEMTSDGMVEHWPIMLGNQTSLRQDLAAVHAPFGPGLIISIASSTPLFPSPPPRMERRSAYIPVLHDALQSLAAGAGKISVAALPFFTHPAPAPPMPPGIGTANGPADGTFNEPIPPLPLKKHHREHKQDQ